MKAYGVGIKTTSLDGSVLDVKYIKVETGKEYNKDINKKILASSKYIPTQKHISVCNIDTDLKPDSIEDVYLRLQLLSNRLIKPNTVNLDNLFDILPNNVWTNYGPITPSDLSNLELKGFPIVIKAVDKIPYMLDYCMPTGVRIANIASVRLGAYLQSGTTVMPSGFVNYNAGTLGSAMIEGRVSQGVTIDDNSDIGGGASIMGTLSGGGTEKIKIGKNCLLGANSGVGISLGDNCTIEAGLYVTAGTKILYNNNVVKGSFLSNKNDLLFIRNSQTGIVTASNKTNETKLNKSLHNN
jgi:2,3,4,5-tetrahydropyridine-2-carboxylate N-succinyltransferase